MHEITPSDIGFDPIKPELNPAFAGRSLRPTGRVEVMRQITSKLPLNDIGLPTFIYRTDLIPPNLLHEEEVSREEQVDVLNVASLQLAYDEGYPSLPNGEPFWNQLPFEPALAFKAFLDYLGVVEREDDTGRFVAPVRTLEAIHKFTAQPIERLRELSYLYYWPQRAKAYDQFMLANFQKQREVRALHVEDSQFIRSKKWLKKAEERLEAIFEDEDELMDMKPKDVFNMMVELMRMQRISAGLPAAGPAPGGEATRGASLQNTIRKIAEQAGEKAFEAAEENIGVEELLSNPEAMQQLQELITNVNVKSR